MAVTYIDENGQKRKGTTEEYYRAAAENAGAVLAERKAANEAAAEEARRRTQESIDYQAGLNKEQTDAQNKAAYENYQRAIRSLPEQLNAYGITGGMAESSRVGLEANYGNAVNENELTRQRYLSQLREQQAQMDYETEANRRAEDLAAREAYYKSMENIAAGEYQDTYTKNMNAAELNAAVGDYSGYVAMGLMTEEQAAAAKKAWIQNNPQLAKTLGYVSTGRGYPMNQPETETEPSEGLVFLMEKAIEYGDDDAAVDRYLKRVEQLAGAGVNVPYTSDDVKKARAAITAGRK